MAGELKHQVGTFAEPDRRPFKSRPGSPAFGVEVSAENGWAEYRTHIAFMDQVAEMYSFSDHAMRRFQELLKDAVDPYGILSPGKSGIWPQRLRGNRG